MADDTPDNKGDQKSSNGNGGTKKPASQATATSPPGAASQPASSPDLSKLPSIKDTAGNDISIDEDPYGDPELFKAMRKEQKAADQSKSQTSAPATSSSQSNADKPAPAAASEPAKKPGLIDRILSGRKLKPVDQNTKDTEEENPEQEGVNPFTSPITYIFIIFAIVGVCVILYAWRIWPFDLPVESTDDAYVYGNVTSLAPQVSGQILRRPADDYIFVKAGDLLVQIDDRKYKQAVASAKATLQAAQVNLDDYDNNVSSKKASLDLARAQQASAEANLVQAQLDLARVAPLESTGVASHAMGDSARVKLSEAQASVNQTKANTEIARQNLEMMIKSIGTLEAAVLSAEATLASAELDLAHTRVLAPVDGQLGEVGVEAGQLLSSGSEITTITPRNSWVIANFKETQIAQMRVGMPVTFTVDALDHKMMKGYISYIAPATGSATSTIKSNNATGNFTKVVQRIPVRIEIEKDQDMLDRLRAGMSVIVKIDTTRSPLDPLPANISDHDHPIVFD